MFTVVIPLYNKAHIIMRTLASVLTQTYTEFEVIIINDGSTDNSLEVINSFTQDSRIRIFDQSNQGVSAARNRGVNYAQHNYIAFLDADDEWLPGYLEKMKAAIELFPNACLYGCPSWHRNILTGETGNGSLNRYQGKIQKVNYFENPHTMPHISAMVVSKKFFNLIDNGHGFPTGMKACEDWSCLNRLAFLGDFIYVGFPLGIKNNGVSGQITGLNKEAHFKLLKYVINYYNLTFEFSRTQQGNTELFDIFFRYDLRNRILCALKEMDYATIQFLLEKLSPNAQNQLQPLEKILYAKKEFNFIAKIYVYVTKIIWRSHGFPIVGKAN